MFDRSFYFLRHGQTDWNVEGRLQGSKDIPLNTTGVQQAKDVAARLYGLPITTCISSDMGRAVTTAKYALRYADTPLYIEPRLKERCFGTWEGHLATERKASIGMNPHERLKHQYTPPQGEDWDDFTARVVAGIDDLQARFTGDLLLVAHGYVFVALCEALIGSDVMSENCVPYRFEKDKHGWQVFTL